MNSVKNLMIGAALLSALPAKAQMTSEATLSAGKLRYYCQACHGIGRLRFIYSENDQEVWDYIFANNTPNQNKTWAEAIHQVLSWPSDAAPPFDEPMDPQNNRDWMPKGSKRLDLAQDVHADEFVRRIILRAIEEHTNMGAVNAE